MSFNSDHNNSFINRENYEEYFLLLVDNELTKEEVVAVEAFLAAHPDLQPEMDLLLSLKLPAEEAGFLDKEMLLAENMRENGIEESLLLYIDNELDKEDSKWLEERLSKDVQLQEQHQQLLKTKLDAADHVVYPFKKELYRHEDKRKVPLYWMRVAAAVLLAIGIGGVIYTTQQPASTDVASIESAPNKKATPVETLTPRTKVEIATPRTELVQHKDNETKKDNPLNTTEVKSATASVAKQKLLKTPAKKNLEPVNKVNNNIEPVVSEAPDNGLARLPQANSPKQSINTPPVTNGIAASYNNEEAPLTPAVIRDAFVKTDNDKKSSLKGLLRKATRFIERRTNISATNENDELLIGAVALKL
ncbi:MAG TPA: hypothetical protein VM935_13370 [Chitinophagaceae bacterium]|nr:hypothetical protein [Chitinophagaceae bacterium]